MIPTGTLIGPPVDLMAGDAFWLPIQCYLRGPGNVPGQFASADTVAASVFQDGVPTAIFQPSVGWLTTNQTTNLAQTGYDQGQVAVTATSSQGAMLQPSADYNLVVRWTPADDTQDAQDVAIIPLVVGSPY